MSSSSPSAPQGFEAPVPGMSSSPPSAPQGFEVPMPGMSSSLPSAKQGKVSEISDNAADDFDFGPDYDSDEAEYDSDDPEFDPDDAESDGPSNADSDGRVGR
eukprot:TRINITY_DN3834_c0_g2_i1.p2 TRINITY_DN3834_c0_g2~~TRINITY_DN3834_c0_g2_i1.p2  ORF type:complete len:102 (-),score=22.26 TRINITY_DN3834_c0_g2_i1:94-399(-)